LLDDRQLLGGIRVQGAWRNRAERAWSAAVTVEEKPVRCGDHHHHVHAASSQVGREILPSPGVAVEIDRQRTRVERILGTE